MKKITTIGASLGGVALSITMAVCSGAVPAGAMTLKGAPAVRALNPATISQLQAQASVVAPDLAEALSDMAYNESGDVANVVGAPIGVSGTTSPTTPPTTTPPVSSQTFLADQQKLETDLSDRVSRLSELTTKVTSSKDITSSDQTALESLLAGETSGINALVAKVPSDTTVAELAADATSMVDNYRVYLVMSPQVNITVADDTENAVEAQLTALEPQIQALITAAGNAGNNVAGAQAALNDLEAQVTAAQGLSAGISATVLAQNPQGYPGNASVFSTAITGVKGAQIDIQACAADLKTIQADLKGLTSTSGGGSGSSGSGSSGSGSGSGSGSSGGGTAS